MVVNRDCAFCAIIAGRSPAVFAHEWPDAVAFHPLNPVTPGHLLVVSKVHILDALAAPVTAGKVFERAASVAPHPCNLLTSAGKEATQTINHFHVHIVPRRPGDGLQLPWTGEKNV